MNSLNKFILKDNIIQKIGNELTCIEAYAMFYDVIKDIKQKNIIIKRTLELCEQAFKKYKYPCPYVINIYENRFYIYENKNTQHFLWCAKMFYEHYQLTNEQLYYKKAEEIVNYVCVNMYDKKHSTLINWFGVDSSNNKVCVKSLTCAEMLLIFNKKYILDSTLDFMKKKLFNDETGLFDSTFDINTKKIVREQRTYLHENLELIEGLFYSWKYSKEEKYKDLANSLIIKVIPLISSNVNNLAPLQCLYWIEKFEFEWKRPKHLSSYNKIKERVNKIKINFEKNNYISPYEDKKMDNIFGHIYLQRIYNSAK